MNNFAYYTRNLRYARQKCRRRRLLRLKSVQAISGFG